MDKVNADSEDYRMLINRFCHSKKGQGFTYREFKEWLNNQHYKLVSKANNTAMEQAIFESILEHRYTVTKQYRKSHVNGEICLETVYLIDYTETVSPETARIVPFHQIWNDNLR